MTERKGGAVTQLRDTQVERTGAGVVLTVTITLAVGLPLIAALMRFNDAVEHKFGEFTQKTLIAGLCKGIAEYHAVVSYWFVHLKINVRLTITLLDKPMALTILPNLDHAPGLYQDLTTGNYVFYCRNKADIVSHVLIFA